MTNFFKNLNLYDLISIHISCSFNTFPHIQIEEETRIQRIANKGGKGTNKINATSNEAI